MGGEGEGKERKERRRKRRKKRRRGRRGREGGGKRRRREGVLDEASADCRTET